MIKKIFILFAITVFFYTSTIAQVGIGTTAPDGSSALELASTTRGFLPPRMTTAERDLINSGVFAAGLMIYNTDDKCINFWDDSEWRNLCTYSQVIPFVPDPLPGNITLTGGQIAYIASIYDENYLPYTAPTTVAATGTVDADGNVEATVIDVPGVLDATTGVSVSIPYTVVTASVTIPAFSQTVTVISDHVQGANPASTNGGGTATDIILEYATETLPVGTGTITATIKAVSTNLNTVKLDINSGIGTDLGIILAEFTIATDDAGGEASIQLKNIPGIPDRRFGETTTQGGTTKQYHNNLYLPVLADDGNIWLNNNLGANYSDLNETVFDIAQQAKNILDYHAFGSFYQWGRYSDGHELLDTSAGLPTTNWSLVSGTTSTLGASASPGNQHINSSDDWLASTDSSLWQGVNGVNNPCPVGFRVPTSLEQTGVISAEGIVNDATNSASNMKYALGGYLSAGAGTYSNGNYALMWTSDTSGNKSNFTWLRGGTSYSTTVRPMDSRALGNTVRCIQD